MPNHEENYVVVIGEPAKIRAFVNEALIDHPAEEHGREVDTTGRPEKILDFNLVIPMPEVLRNTSAPLDVVETQAEADEINRKHAELWKKLGGFGEVKAVTRETRDRWLAEFGETDWYDWSISHWGTKWNAYSHSHYELRFLQGYRSEEQVYGRVDLRFETAWSQPTPIFEAIEERWGVTVYVVTQDEGGFPDVYFPDEETVKNSEVLSRIVTFEFESWHEEVDEPEVLAVEESPKA